MSSKKFTFKIPSKTSRIRAIGNTSKLPDDSLKKILKTAENFHNPIYAPEKEDWFQNKKKMAKLLINFYLIDII